MIGKEQALGRANHEGFPPVMTGFRVHTGNKSVLLARGGEIDAQNLQLDSQLLHLLPQKKITNFRAAESGEGFVGNEHNHFHLRL